MKEQNTIYAVVRFSKKPKEHGFIVYTKQSSNLEKMKEYKKEIAEKHPAYKVVLLPKEKAYSEQKRYSEWYKKWEDEMWERVYNRLMKNAKKSQPDYYTSQCGGIYNGSLNQAVASIWG